MFAVVGTFDRNGGRSSKIGGRILECLGREGLNGGDLSALELDFSRLDSLLTTVMTPAWMPTCDAGRSNGPIHCPSFPSWA